MYMVQNKNLFSCEEKHCTSANPKVSLERVGLFSVVSFGKAMEVNASCSRLPLLGEQ